MNLCKLHSNFSEQDLHSFYNQVLIIRIFFLSLDEAYVSYDNTYIQKLFKTLYTELIQSKLMSKRFI